MECLNCGSKEIYRKHPESLEIYCDVCNFSWKVLARPKPILQEEGFKAKGRLKGKYRITIWKHPYDEEFFSYAIAINGGVMGGSEIPNYDTLHGKYQSSESAMAAAKIELGLIQ